MSGTWSPREDRMIVRQLEKLYEQDTSIEEFLELLEKEDEPVTQEITPSRTYGRRPKKKPRIIFGTSGSKGMLEGRYGYLLDLCHCEDCSQLPEEDQLAYSLVLRHLDSSRELTNHLGLANVAVKLATAPLSWGVMEFYLSDRAAESISPEGLEKLMVSMGRRNKEALLREE